MLTTQEWLGERSAQMSVRLTQTASDRVKQIAAERLWSLSTAISWIVTQWMAEHPEEPT